MFISFRMGKRLKVSGQELASLKYAGRNTANYVTQDTQIASINSHDINTFNVNGNPQRNYLPITRQLHLKSLRFKLTWFI